MTVSHTIEYLFQAPELSFETSNSSLRHAMACDELNWRLLHDDCIEDTIECVIHRSFITWNWHRCFRGRLSMTLYRVCPVPHSRWTQCWQLLHSRACCCAVMTLKCTLQSPLRAETFIVNNSIIHHGILTLCLYRLLLLGLVHCGIVRRCWAFITHWMQLSATFYWTFLFFCQQHSSV